MAKLKMVTKAQRESHHSRASWLWLYRAATLIVVALLISAWNKDFVVFAGLCLSAAGICWIYGWVHSQLEITCDKGDADCKDDHELGKKTKKKRAVKKA